MPPDPRLVARFFCRLPPLARIQPRAGDLERIGAETLLTLAEEHGLAGLFQRVLHDSGLLCGLPASTGERLSLTAEAARRDHDRRTGELQLLARAFDVAGVPFLLLKEYAFDETFPTPGCVQQSDFDLLIAAENAAVASALLERLGYERVMRPWQNERRYKQPGRTSVDLHLALHHEASAEPGFAALFARSGRLDVGSTALPVLHPVDGLVFLLAHTSLHHNFTPFSKVVNCWNYLVTRLPRLDRVALQAALVEQRQQHLAGFTLGYMEALVGSSVSQTLGLSRPALLDRLLFRGLMPSPRHYFATSVQACLQRRCRDGWQLALYHDTLRARLATAVRLARTRWKS
jgi:hypothetical protein